MRKKELQRQIQMLLAKCENLSADLASAKSVSEHYKKELAQVKNQLEQATGLISDLTAQLEATRVTAQPPTQVVAAVQEPAAQEPTPNQAQSVSEESAAEVPTAPQKVVAPTITAGADAGIDYGAKAIGDAVFACTKFCNGATGELQRDLVHLALGRTEVFKGTVLSVLEGEGTDAQKQQEIAKALSEVLEYFEGLKQQEV